jgi:hypothetical protein
MPRGLSGRQFVQILQRFGYETLRKGLFER